MPEGRGETQPLERLIRKIQVSASLSSMVVLRSSLGPLRMKHAISDLSFSDCRFPFKSEIYNLKSAFDPLLDVNIARPSMHAEQRPAATHLAVDRFV